MVKRSIEAGHARSMAPAELRAVMAELEISQIDLANLVHVTPRAVALWLASSRAIPGSVQAYLNLLLALPSSQRAAELSRLGPNWRTLEEGVYRVAYRNGWDGSGVAFLTFEGGRVFGTDMGKSHYDGSYRLDHSTGLVAVSVRVEIQPGERSVAGESQPFAWTLEARFDVAPNDRDVEVTVHTNVGVEIAARLEFMRALPSR